MSIKMKGLLKGLRYISQIFEEEEDDKEMQIGFPTDVKHVAHIGWDGPSVNSPSWMNEFKPPEAGNTTAPLLNGDANKDVEDVNSQDSSTKRNTSVRDSPARDLPGLPKSSRRQPSMDSIGSTDSPLGSPSHKSRSSRRRHKQKEITSPRVGESSSSQSLPNIPKKSRRKKSKDGEGSVKAMSKSKDKGSRHGSRLGSDDVSLTKQYNVEANSSTSLASLKEEEMKGL
ncbi:CRIB domain-containing protein RIC6 [Spinacia oleracea]|uniref:CRIB domain-containing protein RIC6 n=1 Tax=Spinacia oleracea TaxID=3562 RepID=A0ABM3QUD5_SPIOL|nr:CRIB domain-containing protein RIC6-like [Spinacia oleracea]XP_056686964.1 CRIB domain-containing protein RIC6-like [Spinacia oleracea]